MQIKGQGTPGLIPQGFGREIFPLILVPELFNEASSTGYEIVITNGIACLKGSLLVAAEKEILPGEKIAELPKSLWGILGTRCYIVATNEELVTLAVEPNIEGQIVNSFGGGAKEGKTIKANQSIFLDSASSWIAQLT